MSLLWIENFWTNLLEPQTSHHGVEEDFEELEMIFISGLHELDPLDTHFVIRSIMLCFKHRNICNFLETVNVGAPANKEIELLSESFFNFLEDGTSHGS